MIIRQSDFWKSKLDNWLLYARMVGGARASRYAAYVRAQFEISLALEGGPREPIESPDEDQANC